MFSAGHFEHVAHMNMFDFQRPALCLPVKLCSFDLTGNGVESINSGRTNEEHGPSEPEGTEKKKNDRSAQIVNYIKRDLGFGRHHDSSDSEDGESSHSRKSHKTLVCEKRKTLEKKRESNIEEENEWKSAKQKVEEFLDFPGRISNLTLTDRPIRRHPASDTQCAQADRVTQSKPVPNTRHNALFLRDVAKDAQKLWLMSHRPDAETIYPPEHKEYGNGSLDGVVENPSSGAEHEQLEGESTYLNRLLSSRETRFRQPSPEKAINQSERTKS